MTARPEFPAAEARRFYDRLGSRLDSQAFYEDPAVDVLLQRGDFSNARSVFELGCGTGRLAERLLNDFLTPDAMYLGVDVSPVMVGLASRRLARFGSRARVLATAGEFPLPVDAGCCDRFISTFVFDLLPATSLLRGVEEAARLLETGGLLCNVSITHGSGFPSRLTMALLEIAWKLNPRLVGGCRPIELTAYLERQTWKLCHRETVRPWGVASEILIARRK